MSNTKLNLRKKIVSASIYNAPSQKNKYFIWYLTNLVEFYSTRHEKVIIFGDFNKGTENFTIWWNRIYVSKVTEFVHRFTNYKFEIFIYEDKLLWNWFEWSSSYDIYKKSKNANSETKIWKVWTKGINIPQFQTTW